jgi:uncharacterized protein
MAPQQVRTIDPAVATSLLAGPRIAVIGASDDKGSFGRTIALALRDHGVETVAVHPAAASVDGIPGYATVADVPGHVDAAVVMVAAPASVQVVRECAAAGISKVWLFKGLGGPGAASDEAIEVAEELGLEVVPGACPMMFLEPVGWFHRIHRAGRRRNGSLARVA